MKRLYGAFILFLSYFGSFGQVVFDQLPRDLQLYPRDATNQAAISVSGSMSGTAVSYTKIGVQVLREGLLTKALSQTLSPSSTTFKLTTTIKAETAEYGFRVFAYKGADSVLVAERKRVVCGDVYIIHGQSNALALAGLDTYYSVGFDDKYLRNAAYSYGSPASNMTWFPAKQPYASVGGLGLTIQRLILQTYGIPTCVINGAQGGTQISLLLARNPANHADTNTFYGNLLYRAQWAGVARQAKAIIFRQGEEDAGTGISGYAGKFATLYNQLREDYGDMRIYVGQINILDNTNPNDSAAALRDFQRRTKFLFKNVETIASVGTVGYQGVHYEPLAYQQLAFEQFRQLARDIYGSTDTLQINSPDVKKTFYNARKDSITLVFDDQMQMVWKSDTAFYSFATGVKEYGREQKDYFYLDGKSGLVAGGSATGNRVILALNQPATAKTLRYLPAYFSDNFSAFYDGPVLKNSRGMRAFSFDGVPIADAIATVTTLAAKPLSEKQIQLNWTVSANAQTQLLERSDGTPSSYKQIASFNGTTATYTDTNLPDPLGTYYYRLRASNSTSESGYSNVVIARPLILEIEPTEPLVQLYPNPLSTDRLLHVEASQVTFTNLSVRDLLGRVVKSWSGTAKNTLTLGLSDLEAGLYIANLQTTDGQTLRRKIVIR
ncbi:sialate O-acetylesterase [Spirosoma foliorum]|uniref:T9SS type A sorting domain-containing protein n=1 Tax=Spirosoma foliorum TaxID=2710596 RepID=A0A7G5H4E1_9BACT|nr:sialate O-acetylesterase [Spirosoma foliorum]QMW05983.1 T9SS type A sorting domain-containing protein [Spirosoma foliorum]